MDIRLKDISAQKDKCPPGGLTEVRAAAAIRGKLKMFDIDKRPQGAGELSPSLALRARIALRRSCSHPKR